MINRLNLLRCTLPFRTELDPPTSLGEEAASHLRPDSERIALERFQGGVDPFCEMIRTLAGRADGEL